VICSLVKSCWRSDTVIVWIERTSCSGKQTGLWTTCTFYFYYCSVIFNLLLKDFLCYSWHWTAYRFLHACFANMGGSCFSFSCLLRGSSSSTFSFISYCWLLFLLVYLFFPKLLLAFIFMVYSRPFFFFLGCWISNRFSFNSKVEGFNFLCLF